MPFLRCDLLLFVKHSVRPKWCITFSSTACMHACACRPLQAFVAAHGTAAQIGQRMLVQLGWAHRTPPALFMEAIRRYRHTTPSECTPFPFLALLANLSLVSLV